MSGRITTMGSEVKFIGLATFAAAARRIAGEKAYGRAIEALPEATRELFAAPPLPIAWVDAAHYFALIDALWGHAFGGRAEMIAEVARAQVDQDLRGIYRLFVKLATPDFIVQRAASLYGSYWRAHGSVRAEKTGLRQVTVSFEDLPRVHPLFLQAQIGAIQAALELSGVKGVRVEILETSARGARLRASWA